MFTKRQLLKMFWPVLLDMISSLGLGTLVTMMLSGMGEYAVNATSIVGTIVNVCYILLNSITAGLIVVVSQEYGAGDMEKCRKVARQGILAMAVIGTVVAALTIVFGESIILALFGDADMQTIEAGKIYLVLTMLSVPFFGVYHASNSVMYATGDFKRTMKNSLVINITNLILCAVFIKFLNLGIWGAGIAIIICRAISGFLVYRKIRQGTDFIRVESAITKPDFKVIWSMLRIGIAGAIDGLIITGSSLIIQVFIVKLGSTALAANSISGSMATFAVIASNAVATMSVTIIGHAYGAGDMKQCRKYMMYMLAAGAICTVIGCGVCVLVTDWLIGLYNPLPETAVLIKKVFYMIMGIYVLLWSPSQLAPACLRGTGDVKYSTVVSVLSLTLVKVPLVCILTIFTPLGLVGVQFAALAEWIIRAVFLMARIFSGKWEKSGVVQEA